MTLQLNQSLIRQIEDAARAQDITPKQYVEQVMYAHFDAKLKAKMPKHKDIVLANVNQIQAGTEFVVTDIMDSIHKGYPGERRTYGQILALLIARRTVRAEFTGKHKGTLKVYRKQ